MDLSSLLDAIHPAAWATVGLRTLGYLWTRTTLVMVLPVVCRRV